MFLVSALLTNSTHMSGLPPITAEEMSVIVPKLPQLIVDAVNIIIHDGTNVSRYYLKSEVKLVFLKQSDKST